MSLPRSIAARQRQHVLSLRRPPSHAVTSPVDRRDDCIRLPAQWRGIRSALEGAVSAPAAASARMISSRVLRGLHVGVGPPAVRGVQTGESWTTRWRALGMVRWDARVLPERWHETDRLQHG